MEMHIKNNFFLKGVMDRLFQNQKTEVSFQETFLYMKQFLPIEKLHIDYYDPTFNLLRVLLMAENGGTKKNNMIVPFTNEDLARMMDPNTPDEEVIEIDRKIPSLVRYNEGLPGVSVLSLRLKKRNIRYGLRI